MRRALRLIPFLDEFCLALGVIIGAGGVVGLVAWWTGNQALIRLLSVPVIGLADDGAVDPWQVLVCILIGVAEVVFEVRRRSKRRRVVEAP